MTKQEFIKIWGFYINESQKEQMRKHLEQLIEFELKLLKKTKKITFIEDKEQKNKNYY